MVIDYGYLEGIKNFSLQSLHNNRMSNVLENIGYQDITALVDFSSLINLANLCKLKTDIYTSQRDFFIKYGIKERAKKILSKSTNIEKKIINEGMDRIIDANNMGSIFKVLIISKK